MGTTENKFMWFTSNNRLKNRRHAEHFTSNLNKFEVLKKERIDYFRLISLTHISYVVMFSTHIFSKKCYECLGWWCTKRWLCSRRDSLCYLSRDACQFTSLWENGEKRMYLSDRMRTILIIQRVLEHIRIRWWLPRRDTEVIDFCVCPVTL